VTSFITNDFSVFFANLPREIQIKARKSYQKWKINGSDQFFGD